MSKAAAARKLASAAAYGGGGLSVLGGALYGVLRAEAKLARRTIGEPTGKRPPDATGWYGRRRPGPGVKIALLGDSSAAGYGVWRVEETPGALLASGVAEAADRRVFLRSFAVVGAQTSHLEAQIDRALPTDPDVAVILIGANDVTHTVLPSQSVQRLGEAVRRLREADVAVVVGTCPDLGTIKPIAPPLKQVARSWSRRLAAAQTIAVVEAGGRSVSLGSILGPEFAAAPALLFGPDQFHPSADGYHQLASVLLPSVLAALDLLPDEDIGLSIRRGDVVLPVAEAAIQAVRSPGIELDGTEVAGAQRGLRGRWVQLSRRGRQPQGEVEPPEAEEPDEGALADRTSPDMAKPPEREDSGDSTSMISRG
jgi:lysophospholipase L1-like esterase